MSANVDPDELAAFICETINSGYGRRHAVVGVSGGIDSAVTLALTVKAVGQSNTRALLMPERESSEASTALGVELCEAFGVAYEVEDITNALAGMGCYARRDAAIKDMFADYEPEHDLFSIHIQQDLARSRMPATYLFRVSKRSGAVLEVRPSAAEYRSVLAASSMKQRVRTMMLYYFAELDNACVVGTSNYNEEYLGFFVKLGDGSWDLCPIEGFTKTAVQGLALSLGIPASILGRTTTTDTFPVEEQSQEDMFYKLPFDQLDVILDGMRSGMTAGEIAKKLDWPDAHVANAIRNLSRRHRSTHWNRTTGLRYSSS
jgi:NAD+ synthase